MNKPLPIIAFDPGCTRCGFARIVLHRDHLGGRFTYDRGGHRELDRGWLHAELQQLRDEGGVFALEVLIGGRFKGRMTASLNETAQMQGRILGIAEGAGLSMPPHDQPLPMVEQRGVWVLLIPAGDGMVKRNKVPVKINGWRGELCHTSQPSNKQIAVVVERIIDGIPHLHHLAREHAYDALGLAFVAAHRHLGLPVRLPLPVEQALTLQRIHDKARPEKTATRLYSRAARAQMSERAKQVRAR